MPIMSKTIPNLVGMQMYYIPPEIEDPEATPIYQNWNANIIKDRVENRIQYDSSTNPNNVLLYSWNMEYQEGVNPPVHKNYFWIKNEGVNRMIVSWDSDFEYRGSNAEWVYFSGDVVVSPGEKIEVRRDSQTTPSSISVENNGDFDGSERYSIGGNIMSLLYGENFENQTVLPVYSQYNQCTLENLFQGQNIIDASALELPATSISQKCYNGMFKGCHNLVYAPTVLPATSLTQYCYQEMFTECYSLVNAPELPALDVSWGCYQQMFEGCSSLTTPPVLDSSVMVEQCYYRMFNGCSSLQTAPDLPAKKLSKTCYSFMFAGCSSLTTPPALHATDLDRNCYRAMFNGCSSLTTAPDLNASILTSGCYAYMFEGCSSLQTAPELPALDLVNECYKGMFTDCSSLNYVKAMFTTPTDFNNQSDYIQGWLSGVSATGTFVKNINNSSLWPGAVPSGWTIQTASS